MRSSRVAAPPPVRGLEVVAVRRALQGQSANDPSPPSAVCDFRGRRKGQGIFRRKGVVRLIETGRHVYTNWESVLGRRSAHPKLDPYAWVGRADPITAETCPKTLDILARTCSVQLLPDIPMPAYRLVVRRMVNASRA